MVRPIETPVVGPEAFGVESAAASLSRAAILLLLRAQLRGDDQALAARSAAPGQLAAAEAIPERDLARFPVPRLRRTGERVSREVIRERIARRYLVELKEGAPPRAEPQAMDRVIPDLAARLYERPSLPVAAELLETCLSHPDDLTRVAAAAAYFEICADPVPSLDVLAEGIQMEDELVRDVAATSLARVAPADPRLARLTEPGDRRKGGAPAYTSLLVHGTFARNFPWWQPGGGFHTYLSGVLGDLYGASDRFEWSGGYSDERRALGAQDLGVWVDAHNVQGLDPFAHSHGGSVAMLASQFGLELGKLVLLSCPAHPQKYMPDFGHVGKVVSVRVHLDLVILADGGGQRFQHPGIRENVLPIWFDHSATHDPDVWETYDIPSKI
jgi:hypothetical protein